MGWLSSELAFKPGVSMLVGASYGLDVGLLAGAAGALTHAGTMRASYCEGRTSTVAGSVDGLGAHRNTLF